MENQIEKLERVLAILDTDRASTDEVAEVIRAVLEMIGKMREELEQNMAQNKGETEEANSTLYKAINRAEVKLEKLIDQNKKTLAGDIDNITKQFYAEVKDIRELIPTVPSFEPLERRIEEVEQKIPKIPEIPDVGPIKESIEVIEKDIEEIKNAIEELKRRPVGRGGGVSAMGVRQAFKYIFHTEALQGTINGSNADFTVSMPIWAVVGITLNGESIAQLPNFTIIGNTIRFSSAIPGAYSGKDFELKFIG